MSIPIVFCQVVKACTDEKAYQKLLEAMKYNMTQMAFTQMPCMCEPKCTATKQQIDALNVRLQKDMYCKYPEAKTIKPKEEK